MRETTELKEIILKVAGDLFAQNGYAGTSIKQIAKAAGCTTAALYYYFEDGKAHILRDVVRSYSTDVLNAVDEQDEFEDLETYLEHLAQRIGQNMPKMSRRLSWLLPELPDLPAREREQFTNHFLGLHRTICTGLEQTLPDHERANMLAWIIVCAFLGYGQIFQTLRYEDQSAPSLDVFGHALMAIIVQAA